MKRLNEFIDRFFFSTYDPRVLAVFRIVLGILMLAWCLCLFPNLDRDYARDGMLSLNSIGPEVQGIKWYSVIDLLDGKVPLIYFWIALLVSTLMFIFGFFTRTATVVLWILHTSFLHRNLWASNAEQTTFRMLLFYGMLLPLGAGLSLDQRLFKRLDLRPQVWPVRAAQFHLCLIYLISSPWKWTADEAWRAGDALYYVMINPTWSRWPWPAMFYSWPVSALATYGSLLLEFSFPFLVWTRFRFWVLAAMLLFHVTLGATLNYITFFSLATGAGLTLFLVPLDLSESSIGKYFGAGNKRRIS